MHHINVFSLGKKLLYRLGSCKEDAAYKTGLCDRICHYIFDWMSLHRLGSSEVEKA